MSVLKSNLWKCRKWKPQHAALSMVVQMNTVLLICSTSFSFTPHNFSHRITEFGMFNHVIQNLLLHKTWAVALADNMPPQAPSNKSEYPKR